MKKIFFSMLAATALTAGFTSCNSNDEPNVPNNPGNSDEFVTRTFNINVSDYAQTRAAGDNLPLWGLFEGGDAEVRYLSYAFYKADGTVYSQELNKEIKYYNNAWETAAPSISASLPANAPMKLVVLLAKEQSVFELNPENKTIGFVDSWLSTKSIHANLDRPVGGTNFFEKDHDAFYWYGDINTATTSQTLTLKRPFAQVCILSDESNTGTVKNFLSVCADGYAEDMGDPTQSYIPTKYNFEKDELTDFRNNDLDINNRMFNLQESDATVAATWGGRNLKYLGNFYILCKKNSEIFAGWGDDGEDYATAINWVATTSNGAAVTKTISIGNKNFRQNSRFVITNQAGASSGLLSSSNNFNIQVDQTHGESVIK